MEPFSNRIARRVLMPHRQEHYQPVARRCMPQSSEEIDERDVRVGDVWQLARVRLQVCQPRGLCWKIDARVGGDGMAAFISERR